MRVTSKRIYSERPEIEKAVYERFPVIKEEKKCTTEKALRDGARFEMAKKLYEQETKN
jgi:hypothetical protein